MPNGLDRGTVSKLVGGMLPAEKVHEDIAVLIVGCLGLGPERATLSTQV